MFAVDIQKNENQCAKTRCNESSIKFVKHKIQRRSQYVLPENAQNGGLSGTD